MYEQTDDDELVPFDPEIERTFRRRLREQRAELHFDMAKQRGC